MKYDEEFFVEPKRDNERNETVPLYTAIRRYEIEVLMEVEADDPQTAVEKAGGYIDTTYHPNFPDAIRDATVTVPFDEITVHDPDSDEELATS